MTGRGVLLLAVLQCGVWAQLELDLVADKSLTPVTAILLDVGTAAPGDTITTSFHVKNLGTQPVSMLLNVAGSGFKLTIYDLNPCMLAPAASAATTKGCGDFDVLFTPTSAGPSYSAVLTVSAATNVVTLNLKGTAMPEAVVNFGVTQLAANGTANFGQVLENTTLSKTFTLTNPYSTAVHVGAISVAGSAFSGPVGISPPLDIQPGGSSSFQVTFAPKSSGPMTGSLTVDERTFVLTGLATVPALPKGTITVTSQTAVSGQQMSVSIALASTSQTTGNGTLTLAFQPAPGLPDDAAVQFLSGAKRNATVTISPGDSTAKIDGQTSLAFQTGTTAGNIVLTLTLSNSSDSSTVTIAPALVKATTATGTRQIDAMDVSIIGFDNTHSVSQLSFTFYDASGNTLQPGVIRVDASPNFKQYYAANQVGGAFVLGATFPVTGDTSQIASVDVQISNSLGIASLTRIQF